MRQNPVGVGLKAAADARQSWYGSSLYRSKRSATISHKYSPMGIADVAAGDGALQTCSERGLWAKKKIVHQAAVFHHGLGPDAGGVRSEVGDRQRGAVFGDPLQVPRLAQGIDRFPYPDRRWCCATLQKPGKPSICRLS